MMSTKLVVATIATVLALGGIARAGEGNGDPFPTPDVGVRTTVTSPHYTMGGTAPYNYFSPGTTTSMRSVVVNGAVPFGMAGRVIRTAPAASPVSPAIAATPGPSSHG